MVRYNEQDNGQVSRATSKQTFKKKPSLGKSYATLEKFKPYIKQMIDRGIKSKMELKRGLMNIDINLTTSGTMTSIFLNLTQGVTRRARVGNAIFITKIYGRWTTKSQADSGSWGAQVVRTALVRSKAGFLNATVDGPLDVNGNISAERGAWDKNTVSVLYDNTGYLTTWNSANPGSGNYGGIMKEEVSIAFNKKSTFEQPDTTPNPLPAENGVYLFLMANNVSSPLNAPSCSGFLYYDFYDA